MDSLVVFIGFLVLVFILELKVIKNKLQFPIFKDKLNLQELLLLILTIIFLLVFFVYTLDKPAPSNNKIPIVDTVEAGPCKWSRFSDPNDSYYGFFVETQLENLNSYEEVNGVALPSVFFSIQRFAFSNYESVAMHFYMVWESYIDSFQIIRSIIPQDSISSITFSSGKEEITLNFHCGNDMISPKKERNSRLDAYVELLNSDIEFLENQSIEKVVIKYGSFKSNYFVDEDVFTKIHKNCFISAFKCINKAISVQYDSSTPEKNKFIQDSRNSQNIFESIRLLKKGE